MKLEQAFITEINVLKKLDSLINDIENFDLDQTVTSGAKKLLGKPGEEETLDGDEEPSQESETLSDIYKIIKTKKAIRVRGVVIDIFAAVVVALVLKRLTPMKREILLALPIKQVLKYAVKNIDKLFVKF